MTRSAGLVRPRKGDITAEPGVAPPVHLGHPPTAEQLADLVTKQMLKLDGTHITDEGLTALKPHNLMWLILENKSQVTDAGLVHLPKLGSLWLVNLSNTKITDAGLAVLAGMPDLSLNLLSSMAGSGPLEPEGSDYAPWLRRQPRQLLRQLPHFQQCLPRRGPPSSGPSPTGRISRATSCSGSGPWPMPSRRASSSRRRSSVCTV